ncbi:MAG: hypothetical protein D4S01_11295 [Dehalococcoidia bacterium]|nr:MAG: hypothetical protein D4S01_11295 [Dehalococcoidia bacterium]
MIEREENVLQEDSLAGLMNEFREIPSGGIGDTMNLDTLDETEDVVVDDDTTDTEDNSEDSSKEEVEINDNSNDSDDEKTGSKEIKDETVEDTNEDNDSTETSNNTVFSLLAKVLAEGGVVSSVKEDDSFESVDDIKSLMDNEIKRRADEKYTPEQLELLDSIAKGVPIELVAENHNQILQYDTITETNIEEDSELQERLTRDYEINIKGSTEEEVEALIDSLADTEKMSKVAHKRLLSFHKEFINNQKIEVEKVQKQRLEQEEKFKSDIKEFVTNNSEIIPGIKINKKQEAALLKNMTEHKVDSNGNRTSPFRETYSENPLRTEVVIQYLHLLTNGFKDLSVINNYSKTNVTKEFERAMKNTKSKSNGMGNSLSQNNDLNTDLIKALGKFKQ